MPLGLSDRSSAAALTAGRLANLVGAVPPIEIFSSAIKGDGITDDSVALKAAHDAAAAQGVRVVYCAKQYNAPTLSAASNVIFVGPGTLLGTYRKRIIPVNAPTPVAYERGVVPAVHLAKFIATTNPTVVVVSDSIGTAADQVEPIGYITKRIRMKLMREYPGKNFTFYERGIGSTGWSHFASNQSVPALGITQVPSWYTNTNATYMSYIQALQPDLIFFHFGMNSGSTSNEYNGMISAMAQIEAFTKVPDRVIITNFLPTLQQVPQWGSFTAQEAREVMASLQRGYAIRRGFGLIDNNRYFNMARDGWDPLGENFKLVGVGVSAPSTPTTPWTYPTQTHDWAMQVLVSAGSVGTLSTTQSLNIGIGSTSDNNIELYKLANGNFGVSIRAYGTTFVVNQQDTGVPVPSGSTINLEFSVKGNFVRLAYSQPAANPGLFPTELFAGYVERFGGLMNPRMQLTGGSPTFYINNLMISEAPVFMPTMTDQEFYGLSPYGYGSTYGGSGNVHPSAQGTQRLYGPVLDRMSFAA